MLVPTPAGLLGLSVCYDMRFPELYRQHVGGRGAVVHMPSAFTVPTGRAHWETLLRARAIENSCYVVAAAQWGRHASGRETYGDSLIVDYWGDGAGAPASGVGVMIARAGPGSAARETRRNFPALTHRVL